MKWVFRIALLALATLIFEAPAPAQIGVTVSFGPPALPVYELPPCPGDGYLWTPGYWAYDADGGYYWVPGTWIMAPEPGFLWTPGWWGWETGGFLWHEGFWGASIGFYGGINYGFGYFGTGFFGGRWEGGVFRYNTAVLNVNTTIIHNTYVDRTVINNTTVNRVSYNGGQGGITARPSPEEERAAQGRHVPPTSEQTRHVDAARSNPEMRASQNHGKPSIAATSKAGDFKGEGVVKARDAGAPYHEPSNAGGARPGTESAHPAGAGGEAHDLQPHQAAPVNTGNAKLDKKYQQQQEKLVQKQNQEHQKLEQQQEKEHQQAQKQNLSQQKQQQMEQKHQQQTQQLEQRHTQQTQQLQSRQAPRPR